MPYTPQMEFVRGELPPLFEGVSEKNAETFSHLCLSAWDKSYFISEFLSSKDDKIVEIYREDDKVVFRTNSGEIRIIPREIEEIHFKPNGRSFSVKLAGGKLYSFTWNYK